MSTAVPVASVSNTSATLSLGSSGQEGEPALAGGGPMPRLPLLGWWVMCVPPILRLRADG